MSRIVNAPVVEVAADERHERSASRMNPANWQPSGNLRDLWVIARENFELQLGRGFHGQAGVLLSESCPLRLAAAIDTEQNQWRGATHGQCGILRLRNHDDGSWNQKGTRHGSLGFHGLRLRAAA